MPYLQFTTEEIAQEEWRDVVGYETYYQVSNLGRVKRLEGTPKCRKTRIIRGCVNDGYPYVTLCVNVRKKNIGVHCLVAMAFIGPYPVGYEVNHIDHNTMNPRLSNLEYLSHKGNAQYAAEQGRLAGRRRRALTPDDIPVIRSLISQGQTNVAIGRRFSVTPDCISHIRRGLNWKHIPI